MPRITLEINDNGEIVDELPEPLKAVLTREQTMAYGNGFKNGVSETTEKTRKQFEETLKAEIAKKDALAPLEREKFARIEEENTALNNRLTEAMRESNQSLRAREEAHAKELLSRADSLKLRDERIAELVSEHLEGLALSAGAREESLPELKLILGNYVGYSDDRKPYVKGTDGKPRRLPNGQDMPLRAFVEEYLGTHPHHRRPTTGPGGGARGGASLQGHSRDAVSLDSAKRRIDAGDRSAGAINELFEASRKRAG